MTFTLECCFSLPAGRTQIESHHDKLKELNLKFNTHTHTHTSKPALSTQTGECVRYFDINHLRGQYILHKVALIKSLNARYQIFQKQCK